MSSRISPKFKTRPLEVHAQELALIEHPHGSHPLVVKLRDELRKHSSFGFCMLQRALHDFEASVGQCDIEAFRQSFEACNIRFTDAEVHHHFSTTPYAYSLQISHRDKYYVDKHFV